MERFKTCFFCKKNMRFKTCFKTRFKTSCFKRANHQFSSVQFFISSFQTFINTFFMVSAIFHINNLNRKYNIEIIEYNVAN